jgi:hypothetical protein
MYTNCKYVVMETNEGQNMYLFPSRVVHKTVALNMNGNPISAGFIGYTGGEFKVRGKSESLRLSSRAYDNVLLMELLDL